MTPTTRLSGNTDSSGALNILEKKNNPGKEMNNVRNDSIV
jgi:hypothetical protein